MNIEVRKQIAQILIEWKALVQADLVEAPIPKSKFPLLTLRCGICANVLDNIEILGNTEAGDFNVFDMELEEMFREDGLDEMYPFNSGAVTYSRECKTNTVHMNTARMAWVDKIIAQYG